MPTLTTETETSLPQLRIELSLARQRLATCQTAYTTACRRIARGERVDSLSAAQVSLNEAIARTHGLEALIKEGEIAAEHIAEAEREKEQARIAEEQLQAKRAAFEEAQAALRAARTEVEQLNELMRSLPDKLGLAQAKFQAALREYNKAKDALEA